MSLLLLTTLALVARTPDFRAQLEAVAGGPVAFDPRTPIPDCPGGHRIGWRGDGRAILAECPATGWRLTVLAGAAAATGPVGLKRGDRVTVDSGGDGFTVRAEAIVESARPDGMVLLRNSRTGTRISARLLADGKIVAAR